MAPRSVDCSDIIAQSRVMKTLLDLGRRMATHPATILLTGESGSGKEVVARFIHAASPRAAGPFVAVSCAALSPALVESELFGHARGAFTGADAPRRGLVEAAEGGSLFLDEIGEFPFDLQVKLLRFLQEGEFTRLGETLLRRADVRIMASTSRDLSADMASGRFRKDLYHRLNALPLHVPPLRERPEDVAALAVHMAQEASDRQRRPPVRMAPDALAALQAYAWPGNVRELQNVIEQTVLMIDGDTIRREDLPERVRILSVASTLPGMSLARNVRALERRLIQEALASAHGHREQAARMLEISPRTLAYKMKALEEAD